MTRRASSLANIKLKTPARVEPSRHSLDDIEMQSEARTARAFSMPNFSVTSPAGEVAVYGRENDSGAYPV